MNEDFKTLKRVTTALAQYETNSSSTLISDDDFSTFAGLLYEKQELIHRIYYSINFHADYNPDSVLH